MYYSKSTIQFNYNRAIAQARELDSLANQLENLAKRDVNDTLSAVSHSWSGDSARAFISKGHKAREDMMASARQLRNVASGIRKAAKNVRDAEERARQIALIASRTSAGGGGGGGGAW